MTACTISAHRRVSQPKPKAACDQCNASKVKCPGGGPPCKRCADSSQPCHYSLARRFGKPPGSKNRKTIERLRKAKEGNLENKDDAGYRATVAQYKGSADNGSTENGSTYNGDGAMEGDSEHLENDESLDRPQSSSSTSIWPMLPVDNYPAFHDASQFINSAEQDLANVHDNVPLDAGNGSVLYALDPKFPVIEGLERAEARRLWADGPDGCWDCSSPSIDQCTASAPADTDSAFSEYPHPSRTETSNVISLDAVAARLEETAESTITQVDQRQSVLCQCLPKCADVLCKLQTIEKCQRPVQVDTLLTCTNLILNIAENHLRCGQCLYDSCVAMQLIMIFSTIFTWSQYQCQFLGSPSPYLCITLGQHELTEDECTFIKTALISKILGKTTTLLKLMMPRIEHAALNRQCKQIWGYEREDSWNPKQLVSSLIQKFDILIERLALR